MAIETPIVATAVGGTPELIPIPAGRPLYPPATRAQFAPLRAVPGGREGADGCARGPRDRRVEQELRSRNGRPGSKTSTTASPNRQVRPRRHRCQAAMGSISARGPEGGLARGVASWRPSGPGRMVSCTSSVTWSGPGARGSTDATLGTRGFSAVPEAGISGGGSLRLSRVRNRLLRHSLLQDGRSPRRERVCGRGLPPGPGAPRTGRPGRVRRSHSKRSRYSRHRRHFPPYPRTARD